MGAGDTGPGPGVTGVTAGATGPAAGATVGTGGGGTRPAIGSPRHFHGRSSTSNDCAERRSRIAIAPAASATTSRTCSPRTESPSSPRAITDAASRANNHSSWRFARPIDTAARCASVYPLACATARPSQTCRAR